MHQNDHVEVSPTTFRTLATGKCFDFLHKTSITRTVKCNTVRLNDISSHHLLNYRNEGNEGNCFCFESNYLGFENIENHKSGVGKEKENVIKR